MPNHGYIGLGAMGARIVERLLAKGHSVTGYNRTKAKAQPLIERGMRWADSPRDVAAAVDVVFVMVTDSAALDAVASGPGGLLEGLSAGKVVIDISNPLNEQFNGRVTSPDTSAAETIRAVLPHLLEQGKKRADAERNEPVLLSPCRWGPASSEDRPTHQTVPL